MMKSDQRAEWSAKLLTDARVIQFWDDSRLLGNWYATFKEFSKGSGDTVWDAYFSYNADSTWINHPSGLIGWGTPIITHKTQFLESVVALLNAPISR